MHHAKHRSHLLNRTRRVVFTASIEYGGEIRRCGDEIIVPVHVADALIGAGVASLEYLTDTSPEVDVPSSPSAFGDDPPKRRRGRPRKVRDGDGG